MKRYPVYFRWIEFPLQILEKQLKVKYNLFKPNKKKHSFWLINNILKEFDEGKTTSEICREYGINQTTFYQWFLRFGRIEVQELNKVKELEEENLRLKRRYTELTVDLNLNKDNHKSPCPEYSQF